jgi:hypothetical protein
MRTVVDYVPRQKIDLAVGKTTYPSSIAAVSKEETRTAILFRSISDVPQIEVGGGLKFHRNPTGGPIVKNEVWTRCDPLSATAERSDDLNLEPTPRFRGVESDSRQPPRDRVRVSMWLTTGLRTW